MDNKLYISNEADRLTVATILIKNDYTVSQKREKQGNKTIKYLELTKEK